MQSLRKLMCVCRRRRIDTDDYYHFQLENTRSKAKPLD